MYPDEAALVDELVEHLEGSATPWGEVQVLREFFYQRGRTDVVAVTRDGDVLAFEAKLTRWRGALHQAYRNTCFAHRSFVLLPERVALVAQRYTSEFDRRRVGICCLSGGRLTILHNSPQSEPIQPWLSREASLRVCRRGIGRSDQP